MSAAPEARDAALPARVAPLGIVAGGGTLPLAVAEAVSRSGRSVAIFALRGWADPAVERRPHHWIALGQLGRLFRLARAEGCRDIVFIGTLSRPAIAQIRLDWTTLRALPRLVAAFRGGDDRLLKGVGQIFEAHGFRLLGAHEVAPDILVSAGTLGRHSPGAREGADIERGLALIAAIGPYDVGQAVVIADGHVLAIEAAEGTDRMLERVASLRREGRVHSRTGVGVLVKAPKPAQDRRFDLPSIGPQTVEAVARAGLAGIAVVAGETIVAEADRVVRLADEHGVFVIGVPGREAATVTEAAGRPAEASLNVFLVAAEESGDRLGAALMQALRRRAGEQVRFEGIGGRAMAAEGLVSLFAIDELAIIGFSAIPRKLPMLWRRIREAAARVVAARPDVLVIIDSPDFTHRVARRVRAVAPYIPIVDYVSPSVWAWRPGRARAMRGYVDHVLALLPFEPAAHARLGGPPCTYVGHPLCEQAPALRPGPAEAERRRRDPPLVLVLPGSRGGEIARHLAIFGAAIARLAGRCGPLEVVLPTLPHLAERITYETASWTVLPRIVVAETDKWAAFRAARAALAASGTVTLELALAGVPAVVAYRVALVSELVYRAVVRVPTIVLANLVLGENVMPQLTQRQATPERLAAALADLIADTPERHRQLDAFARLDAIMGLGAAQPSEAAADVVLDVAKRGRGHFRREIGM